jgi:hypothetical protein
MEIFPSDEAPPTTTPCGYLFLARLAAALKREAALPTASLKFGEWCVTALIAETDGSIVLRACKGGEADDHDEYAVVKVPRQSDKLFQQELAAHRALDAFELSTTKLRAEGHLPVCTGVTLPFIVLQPVGTPLKACAEDARLLADEGIPLLEAIHMRGYVHGDVKPANFLKVGSTLYINDLATCNLNDEPRLARTDEFSHAFDGHLRFKDDWVSLFLSYLSLASGGVHLTEEQKRGVLTGLRPDDLVSARIWDKVRGNREGEDPRPWGFSGLGGVSGSPWREGVLNCKPG